MFVLSTTLSGHEDWVRSLSFRPPLLDGDVLILASGSQDSTIRLWNFEPYTKPTSATPTQGQGGELSDELLDAFEASLADLDDGEEGGRQISLKHHILTVKTNAQSSQQFSITFDALLVGHEAGVTSLSWRPQSSVSSTPTLMSTSTDSSLILWSPSTILTSLKDGSTSLWINRQRFGDIGGQRLGGFVGGLWAHGGMDALAWGWSGGWRRWRCNTSEQNESDSNRNEEWAEVGAISGHSAASRSNHTDTGGIPALDKDGASISVWHELSRPQVHGYDLVGVVFLDALRFVSIADEKAVRVFEAPREFVDVINNLGVAQLVSIDEERPRAAAVPPLGLSNKAIAEGNSEEGTKPYDIVRTRRRPFEGELAAITLWPEIEKIFGHGYESIALAVSNSKRFIATACKATVPEHAVIRVHDTENWQLFGQPLAGHSLTVTQIAFSPDDRFILSVSRIARGISSRKKKMDTRLLRPISPMVVLYGTFPEPIRYILLTFTVMQVKIWHPKNAESSSKWSAVATIQAKAAATAVAFAPEGSGLRKLAIGLESGDIMIHVSEKRDLSDWKLVLTIDSQYVVVIFIRAAV
ncbi:Elongator complex protein 2 [Grifola frondosa]|uniref:Elongator complex protein 2 n=1 Tax=Grifola frondosa TaxID=5627 RepID=A0A1C7MHL5_GRIFR|nr:Elongator complex protein 2 [Grifola frondosa]